MDEITFIKKNDKGNSLSCQDCWFNDHCQYTGTPIMGDCYVGDYWEAKDE
jgi:hypothetical protein